jgi:competence protein ComEA
MLRSPPRAQAPPDPLDEADWRPPPSLRERLRRAVGTPVLVGVVLFLGAVVGAVVLVAAQPHAPAAGPEESEVVGAAAGAGGAADAAGAAGGGAGADPATPGAQADAAAPILVHVVGEVSSPGVVELRAGARVREAIEAAGGATELAVLAGVNLARPVVDGEQILVPDAAAAQASAPAAPGSGAAGGTGLVSLNSADAAALETLPGVGPALAQRILAWRAANGAFASVDQLIEVSGIGARTLEGLRDRVTL